MVCHPPPPPHPKRLPSPEKTNMARTSSVLIPPQSGDNIATKKSQGPRTADSTTAASSGGGNKLKIYVCAICLGER